MLIIKSSFDFWTPGLRSSKCQTSRPAIFLIIKYFNLLHLIIQNDSFILVSIVFFLKKRGKNEITKTHIDCFNTLVFGPFKYSNYDTRKVLQNTSCKKFCINSKHYLYFFIVISAFCIDWHEKEKSINC